MLVLGAGLQGSACAYDLLQDQDVEQVRLADVKIDHQRVNYWIERGAQPSQTVRSLIRGKTPQPGVEAGA